MAQVKSIDAATSTFKDMYPGFPGDILVLPAHRLPNCAGGTVLLLAMADGTILPGTWVCCRGRQ